MHALVGFASHGGSFHSMPHANPLDPRQVLSGLASTAKRRFAARDAVDGGGAAASSGGANGGTFACLSSEDAQLAQVGACVRVPAPMHACMRACALARMRLINAVVERSYDCSKMSVHTGVSMPAQGSLALFICITTCNGCMCVQGCYAHHHPPHGQRINHVLFVPHTRMLVHRRASSG